MRRPAPSHLVAVTLTALTAACAGPEGGYPALAISPMERAYWQAKPVEPGPPPGETPVPAGASVTAKLAALTADAKSAHQRFLDRLPRADRLTAAASGSAMGDEGWSVAQIALAGLVSARNDSSLALTEIDAMVLAAQLASVNAPAPELAPARAAHEQVSALVDEESAKVNALTARLAG
ncbi:MAG: hypothetical protein KGM93_06460 [Sphingomonadales bacterium]|nr:hypothetical protein [Sphingomonadales bacterium]